MTFKIILQPGAVSDIERIIAFLSDRSRLGAAAWRKSWNEVIKSLSAQPESFGLAPESQHYDTQVQQAFFRTRRGHQYRALFVVVLDTVHIIHVRGAGQDIVSPDDLRLP